MSQRSNSSLAAAVSKAKACGLPPKTKTPTEISWRCCLKYLPLKGCPLETPATSIAHGCDSVVACVKQRRTTGEFALRLREKLDARWHRQDVWLGFLLVGLCLVWTNQHTHYKWCAG